MPSLSVILQCQYLSTNIGGKWIAGGKTCGLEIHLVSGHQNNSIVQPTGHCFCVEELCEHFWAVSKRGLLSFRNSLPSAIMLASRAPRYCQWEGSIQTAFLVRFSITLIWSMNGAAHSQYVQHLIALKTQTEHCVKACTHMSSVTGFTMVGRTIPR